MELSPETFSFLLFGPMLVAAFVLYHRQKRATRKLAALKTGSACAVCDSTDVVRTPSGIDCNVCRSTTTNESMAQSAAEHRELREDAMKPGSASGWFASSLLPWWARRDP